MEAKMDQDFEIPMLTVLKNNAILKNIFLLYPPGIDPEDPTKIPQDLEQTLLVGRHPDCQIRLEHPTISRFHLRIHTKPSLKRLSVTDLSSVHGTWISGKRIEPNVRTDVVEGDALRIGLSSRVYMLHWVLFNKACDFNNPVVPLPDENHASDQFESSKEMEDVSMLLCNNEDGDVMESECESKSTALVTNRFSKELEDDENVCVYKNEDAKVLDSVSKALLLEDTKDQDMQCVHLAVNSVSVELGDMEEGEETEGVCSGSSTGPLRVQVIDQLQENEEDKDNSHHLIFLQDNEEISTGPGLSSYLIDTLDGATTPLCVDEVSQEKEEISSGPGITSDLIDTLDGATTPLSVDEVSQENEEISSGPGLTSDLIDTLDGATTASYVDEVAHRTEDKIPPSNYEEEDGAWSFWFLGSEGIATDNNFINSDDESQGTEGENPRKERNFLEDPISVVKESLLWGFWSGIPAAESVYSSSVSEAEMLLQIETQLMNESPHSSNPMEKLCKSEVSSPDRATQGVWSGRRQSASAPQIRTNQVDNEDRMPNAARIEVITGALFNGKSYPEEECCTPEKASYTLDAQSGMNSGQSLSAYSNKENQTPKFLEEQKSYQPSVEYAKMSVLAKRKAHMTPLQTLFLDSPQKSISETQISGASFSIYSNKENQAPQKKSACHPSAECTKMSMLAKRQAQRTPLQALHAYSPQKTILGIHKSGFASISRYSNKENLTPKFLQEEKSASHSSAQGMPCKTLFVDSPQILSVTHGSVGPSRSSSGNAVDKVKRWTMVVDDVKCLLDKNSRKALQLLEGIKRTQLIIPIAVIRDLDFMKQQANFFRRNTDAILASQWIEECLGRTKWWIQIQNSNCGKCTEEDQVLNYALFLRSTQNDKQLVLLSDDATRKIKAMEQGLICESAEEFRKSLINPFSKRFLWADSSPRGRTWSCLDDVILRNHFYHYGSLKSTPKGLKLILLREC